MNGFAVVNPFSGERGATIPFATGLEIESALAGADACWNSPWISRGQIDQRAGLLEEIARLHEKNADRLADILVMEMGKPRAQALGEVEVSASIYRYYGKNAHQFLADTRIEVASGKAILRKAPLGPLLGVMPWNYPLYQVARFAAPNLALGNPVVVKHAPQCPESARVLHALFGEAGFPDGAYTNIFASNDQIAEIIGDARIRGVSVTGSERAGAAVAEITGRHLKKVVLELGGSDPFIVLGVEDLEGIVQKAVAARMDNNGQACNAAKRFIIVDHLYDAFAERLVETMRAIAPGDPRLDVRLGPLSSVEAAKRLEDQVAAALRHGATAPLPPRPRQGASYAPVVLADITEDNPAFKEEFFGPVVQLYRVGSEEEAIAVANATPFGLGAYVFTPDPAQAERVADRLEAGMVFINVVGAEGAELPFGGVKRSGTGRELGAIGMEEFMNRKLIRSP